MYNNIHRCRRTLYVYYEENWSRASNYLGRISGCTRTTSSARGSAGTAASADYELIIIAAAQSLSSAYPSEQRVCAHCTHVLYIGGIYLVLKNIYSIRAVKYYIRTRRIKNARARCGCSYYNITPRGGREGQQGTCVYVRTRRHSVGNNITATTCVR